MNGLGERCGLPPLAEIISALVNIYKVNGNWDLGLIPGLTELVTSFSTLDAKANQPVVGKNAFSHKAGLHVKAVVKDPRSYEAMSPESFNRERKLVIDKYTGRAAIENKFESLGITLKKSDVNSLLKLIKSKPEKVEWTDNELISHAKSFGIEV